LIAADQDVQSGSVPVTGSDVNGDPQHAFDVAIEASIRCGTTAGDMIGHHLNEAARPIAGRRLTSDVGRQRRDCLRAMQKRSGDCQWRISAWRFTSSSVTTPQAMSTSSESSDGLSTELVEGREDRLSSTSPTVRHMPDACDCLRQGPIDGRGARPVVSGYSNGASRATAWVSGSTRSSTTRPHRIRAKWAPR
jgi:hypothetical protein